MSNLSNEDIEGILEDLELKWELDSIDKSALGRGGFGSVHKARCAICPRSQSSYLTFIMHLF